MLACDLVVAADHATFGIPEVQRGLAAGAGGLVRLPKRVGLAVALEMAMTGDPVGAATAQQLGLVNRVVPGDQVLDAAVALAERICRNAPLATRLSKQVVTRSLAVPADAAFHLQGDGLVGGLQSAHTTAGQAGR